MTIDAVIELLVRLLFAMLLLGASLHKFSDRASFSGVLAAYRLFPASMLSLLAIKIPIIEMILGLAWLSGIQLTFVALASAMLMAAYTVAIAINLWRGNVDIDCGCGFGNSKSRATSYQRLSAGLLYRNGALIGLALLALLPSNERLLGILDYATVALACCGLMLGYAAFNQLLANKQVIDSWRIPLIQDSLAQGENADA